MAEYTEERLNQLEMQDEQLKAEMSIQEKKMLIAEAKKRYGKDWTKVFEGVHSGMDWNALKFRIK